jgi:hypothetical protein
MLSTGLTDSLVSVNLFLWESIKRKLLMYYLIYAHKVKYKGNY